MSERSSSVQANTNSLPRAKATSTFRRVSHCLVLGVLTTIASAWGPAAAETYRNWRRRQPGYVYSNEPSIPVKMIELAAVNGGGVAGNYGPSLWHDRADWRSRSGNPEERRSVIAEDHVPM